MKKGKAEDATWCHVAGCPPTNVKTVTHGQYRNRIQKQMQARKKGEKEKNDSSLKCQMFERDPAPSQMSNV